MEFGLKTWNADGTENITVGGRLHRYDGTLSVADSYSATYPYPNILPDGNWFASPVGDGAYVTHGSYYTAFDIIIETGQIRIVYHGGNAGRGVNVELNIFRY